jgi:hypothetical protein
MDQRREGILQANTRAYEALEKTTWEQDRTDNFMVLDGQVQQDDGTVIQDTCDICAVTKTQCVKPSEHFDERDESPPDST